MSQRTQLPGRRPSITIETQWQGHSFTVTVEFDPLSAAPRKVSADTPKGGQMALTIADACVLISIALQHGIALSALSKSLSRVPDLIAGGGASLPGSPIGTILAVIGDAV
jgi:hypothetical protein